MTTAEASLPKIHAITPGSGGKTRGVTHTLVTGSAWSMGTLAITQTLRLASNLVLAKFLTPGDFGLVAIVSAVLTGLQMFSDVGIGPSIIHNVKGEDRAFLNTAFSIQAVRGLGVLVCMLVLAWPVSYIYDPRLFPLLSATGVVALVSALASTGLFVGQRRLLQKDLAKVELTSFVVQLLTTVAWALWAPSAWAIVAGWFLGGVVRTVLSHEWLGGWADRFRIDRACMSEMLRYGRWIFLSTALTFLAGHADRLVLGALVPIGALGVYGMAMMMTRLPADIVARLAHSILFPALANVGRDNTAGLLRGLRRSRTALLPVCLASSVGIAAAGPALLLLAYDQRYHDAVWITPLLACTMWFTLLQATADRALLVAGDTRALAISNGVRVCLSIVLSLAGYLAARSFMGATHPNAGMVGFIAGNLLASLGGHVVILVCLARLRISLWRTDLAYTCAAFVAIAGTWGLAQMWLRAGWIGGQLAGLIVFGGPIAGLVCAWAGLRVLAVLRGSSR